MERSQKSQVVSDINAMLLQSNAAVVVHYKGLTVAEITDLRKKARGQATNFRVIKNSLARLAVAGTEFDKMTSLLNGPTALAFSSDPVAAAKTMVQFSKENEKLVVLGGVVDGQILDAASIKILATMPSLDELRAKIVGVISTPATRIAGVLQAPAGQLARVMAAYATKDQ